MKTRFLHFADCHLGYRQYNNNVRASDFARAFFSVIETAIAEQVDFVLLAGDLFQKRSIDALTLNQAVRGLERLRDANIPCIAIEGNHEMAYYTDYIGWMEFLSLNRLLILLNAKIEEGAMQLLPYSKRSGSYYEPVPGVRIYGLRYQGASTALAIEKYAEALAQHPKAGIEYTIFMAHAGVEEALPDQGGGLSLRQWSVLRPYVDYLALGHVHKPYDYDGWIYNPGSTESCSIAEIEWEERGYYLVEVDTDQRTTGGEKRQEKNTQNGEAGNGEAGNEETENGEAEVEEKGQYHRATLHANPRRRIHRQTVKTDLITSPEHLYDHCKELLERRARDWGLRRLSDDHRPVIELMLIGQLPFDRSALDLTQLEGLVKECCQPLLSLVKNYTQPPGSILQSSETLSRTELEHQVLSYIFAQDVRFRQQNEDWARAATELKKLAVGNMEPTLLVDELTAMVERIEKEGKEQSTASPGEGQQSALVRVNESHSVESVE